MHSVTAAPVVDCVWLTSVHVSERKPSKCDACTGFDPYVRLGVFLCGPKLMVGHWACVLQSPEDAAGPKLSVAWQVCAGVVEVQC